MPSKSRSRSSRSRKQQTTNIAAVDQQHLAGQLPSGQTMSSQAGVSQTSGTRKRSSRSRASRSRTAISRRQLASQAGATVTQQQGYGQLNPQVGGLLATAITSMWKSTDNASINRRRIMGQLSEFCDNFTPQFV